MDLNHYTTVMGDIGAQIGKTTNLMELPTSKFRLELRNGRCDTPVEWATLRKHIRNPTKRVKSIKDNQQATEIEVIVTNTSPGVKR